MRRWWMLAVFCVCGVLFTVQFTSANSPLRVAPAKTTASFSSFDEKATVDLAIENLSSRSVTARVKLELLDTNNGVRDYAEREEQVLPGVHLARFDLSLGKANEALLWCRVRYSITTESHQLTGIIALAEITPDMFEIRA